MNGDPKLYELLEQLGIEYRFKDIKEPSSEQIDLAKKILEI